MSRSNEKRWRACAVRAFLLLVLSFLAGLPASAHDPGMTAATLIVEPDRLVVELSVKAADVEAEGGIELGLAPDGLIPGERLASRQAEVERYILSRTAVTTASGICEASGIELAAVEDGIVAIIDYPCGAGNAGLRYATRMLHDLRSPTVQSVLVVRGEQSDAVALDRERPEIVVGEDPVIAETFATYFHSGMVHLFIGFDHIAFLVALVLWADRWWPVVKVVTAFTLAHSITLALAALGFLSIPGAIVEPLIAFSVVLVAVENFLSRDLSARTGRALFFGLVHGFGFASVLDDRGLEGGALVVALFSFNLGVEAGQLLVVTLVLGMLFASDRIVPAATGRPGRAPWLVYGASAIIAVFGTFWLISRMATWSLAAMP
ncbi:MAG: HupE/UreJ family protein [Geminicoccaceae bacterium]